MEAGLRRLTKARTAEITGWPAIDTHEHFVTGDLHQQRVPAARLPVERERTRLLLSHLIDLLLELRVVPFIDPLEAHKASFVVGERQQFGRDGHSRDVAGVNGLLVDVIEHYIE